MAKKPTPAKSEPDWSEPARDPATGLQLHTDGLPLSKVARAMALAAQGAKSDPEEIVTPEEIAAHPIAEIEADREAALTLNAEQAEPSVIVNEPVPATQGDDSQTGDNKE